MNKHLKKATILILGAGLSSGLLFALFQNPQTANILTGQYKNKNLTVVNISEIEPEKFKLTAYQECQFYPETEIVNSTPSIIINEIAWMGSTSGASHEWIELKNISNEDVNLSGWQILNENERIKIIFPQQTIILAQKPYLLLAREAANKALNLNANLLFTGSIRNSKEGLRLFDNHCQLIDEAMANPNWPAGDNQTKQTMARTLERQWAHSKNPGGTPGKENLEFEPVKQTLKNTNQTSNPTQYPPTPCQPGQIDINTANKTELLKIRHIGQARAEEIIKNRPFVSLFELKNKIGGIGEQRLKDVIEESLACAQ